jgi:hypothetical protein
VGIVWLSRTIAAGTGDGGCLPAIVVAKASRISRHPASADALFSFCQLWGVLIISAVEMINTRDNRAEMLEAIIVANARMIPDQVHGDYYY